MIYDNFVSEVKKHCMLRPREKVLIAVSGGPDSIALLLLFLKLTKEMKFNLSVVHVNHGLRTNESKLDEKFVSQFCKNNNLKLHVKKVNVLSLMKKGKFSLEDAAREARYGAFEEICKRHKIKKVALAHTKDDQAETFIMRVVRGGGLKGLSGIWPVRQNGDITFIRPLLNVSKSEITHFLKNKKQNYRTDSSNLESNCLRNKIRLKTIPYLKKNFNSQLSDALCRQTDILREAYKYIQKKAILAYSKSCVKSKSGININLIKFRKLDITIAYEVLRICILHLKGDLKDFSYVNLNALWQMSQSSDGSESIILSDGILGRREYSNLKLSRELNFRTLSRDKKIKPKLLKTPGITKIKFLRCEIQTQIIMSTGRINYKNNPLVEYIDFDKVQSCLQVRTRIAGDKFKPLGLKKNKSLKDFFIDLKVPSSQRDNIPLITDAKSIIWVAGYRISQDYKVKKDTRQILKLKITYL
jgi:tRNA(Ile)-lysidine synthase